MYADIQRALRTARMALTIHTDTALALRGADYGTRKRAQARVKRARMNLAETIWIAELALGRQHREQQV